MLVSLFFLEKKKVHMTETFQYTTAVC